MKPVEIDITELTDAELERVVAGKQDGPAGPSRPSAADTRAAAWKRIQQNRANQR